MDFVLDAALGVGLRDLLIGIAGAWVPDAAVGVGLRFLEERPVARVRRRKVTRRNRCGQTATGHSDSGREQRLAARLARVRQRKR